jgi:hypothetical protein
VKIQRIDDLFEVWHPYWEWECYQFGMWGSRKRSEYKIKECKQLLANETACRAAMQKAINKFSKSAEHHLTKHTGKRPWLGQAACVVVLSATEVETRIAWNDLLSDDERNMANRIADQVFWEWRANAQV